MENNISEPVVTVQKKYLPVLLILLTLVVVATGAYRGYVWYQQRQIEVPALTTTMQDTLASQGLDGTQAGAAVVNGTIQYSALSIRSGEELTTPKGYQARVTAGVFGEAETAPFRSISPLPGTTTQMVLTETLRAGSATIQPQLYNPNTHEATPLPNEEGNYVTAVAVSPDGQQYAYSYQTEERSAEDYDNLIFWNIAIHRFGITEILHIGGAYSPAWVSTTTLVYVGVDGLYLYDTETQTAKRIFDTYATYTAFDEIVVAGKTIILTKPSLNLIAVLSLDGEPAAPKLTEVGRLVAGTTSYSSPVVSPDGTLYAVVAAGVKDVTLNASSTPSFTKTIAIEVRSLTNATVLSSLPVQNVQTGSIGLHNWSTQ